MSDSDITIEDLVIWAKDPRGELFWQKLDRLRIDYSKDCIGSAGIGKTADAARSAGYVEMIDEVLALVKTISDENKEAEVVSQT